MFIGKDVSREDLVFRTRSHQEQRQQTIWPADGFGLWPRLDWRWLNWASKGDHSLNLLLKPSSSHSPSCCFFPIFWYDIRLSSLVTQTLPLSPEVCPFSLDPKVPVTLHHCFRDPLRQLGVPVLVPPDRHGTCFPELLTQKGLHIAGLGRLLFSSASYTKYRVSYASGLFCPVSWVKQSSWTVN